MTRQAATKVAVQMPQSIEEVDEKVAQIGVLQRNLQEIETKMNEEIDLVRATYGPRVDEIRQSINEHVKEIEAFASVNRSELTEGGKTKTVKLRSGLLSWRLTPPAVSISKIKDVQTWLEEHGLTKFLRFKTEIDRNALLASPEEAEEVPGVAITQHELFVVVPNTSQAEVIKKGKVV